MAEYLLQESGDHLVLEDGSGWILLEVQQPVSSTGCDFVLEDDSGFLLLEDGSLLLQENCGAAVVVATEYGSLITPRKPRLRMEDDELLLLILAADA